MVRAGGQYLRGYIWDCIFAGIHFSFSGYFCACEKSLLSFLHNIVAIALVRIPGVYLTSTLFPNTLLPMGLATAAGSLLSVIICVIAFAVIHRKERRLTAGAEPARKNTKTPRAPFFHAAHGEFLSDRFAVIAHVEFL